VRDGENQSIDAIGTNSLEEKLVTDVNNYFSRMKKIDSFKFHHSLPNYKCGNLIRDTNVQKLEYIIFILLNRMFDHWNKVLPKKEGKCFKKYKPRNRYF
jgi:hypothetical protein